MLESAKRPLFWLGHGIRLSGAVDLIEPFLERFDVPFVTSWQGKDMVRHDHPRFMGHAGVYGHRAANTAVQNADLIIAIGTRLALPQTGYDLAKFAPKAQLYSVDIDDNERTKINSNGITMAAGDFMRKALREWEPAFPVAWLIACKYMTDEMPWLESPLHNDTNGYINSYRFMWELNKWLKTDQVITTDMGTALLTAYPMLRLNGRQRLLTSTGLGEMGFGLPAAIGASVAMDSGEVLCLNCDGGLMFNLQELATIQHHNLPIKIIVFDNDGYSMIKRSQEGLGMAHAASGSSALSFPWWESLAQSFGMDCGRIERWEDMTKLDGFFASTNAAMMIVRVDPQQRFGPKVPTLKDENGNVYSPGLETMV